MQSFTQYTPTEIVFGRGAQKEAGKLAKKWGGSRVLLVYGGGSAVRSGLLQEIKEELDREGIACEELGGVQPNPRLALAREGVEKAIAFQADLILAVGGGSVIDTAKAVAVGAYVPGTDIWDIWMGKAPLTGALPVGAVLTISAAGSETSDSAVLTNKETGKKAGVNSDLIRPRFALMNPELTYSLPKYQLCCGITDILMHTLERYFTPDTEVIVTLSVQKERQKIEVTIPVKGTIIRAEQDSSDMYVSIDLVEEIIERQIKKYKTKLIDKKQSALSFSEAFLQEETTHEETINIVKTKRFAMKPMDPEEACIQMELLGHNFFMFLNADTNEVNVVYKRKGNSYGLIEPEF